ncbi:alpha/beta fold hydrolase [Natronomonas sp. EA1]|uniref:alpha/beta fold hydrolase n=1 Tax=Natronomonas sp. EA1 TaxID=3421655 RepID=UPI003EC12496
MPTATNGGVALHYDREGSGEPVVCIPEAGTGAWLWSWQFPALAGPFDAIAFDPRGTGRSDAADDYSLDALVADVETVCRDAGAKKVHLVGCGLGGMVALAHARRHGRARSLTLFGTPATGEAVDTDALARLFTEEWPEVAFSPDYPLERTRIERWREGDADAETRTELFDTIREFDAGPLYELGVPALCLGGVADPVVPASTVEELADGLPRGRFEAVEGRHLCFAEHSAAVNDAISGFLETHAT